MRAGRLEQALRRASQDLKAIGAGFALVGGLGVSLRGAERTTKDVDLTVAVRSDSEAEQMLHLLFQRGYKLEALLEHTLTGRLATARLVSPIPGKSPVIVDLLFASCGIEPEIVQAAEAVKVFKDLKLNVATTGHLIAMKVLSFNEDARSRDKQDLLALVKEANAGDFKIAKQALELIEDRGFSRGKKLLLEFKKFLKLAKMPEKFFRERGYHTGCSCAPRQGRRNLNLPEDQSIWM